MNFGSFGASKKKTTRKQRIAKMKRKLAKRQKVAKEKAEEARLRKALYGN